MSNRRRQSGIAVVNGFPFPVEKPIHAVERFESSDDDNDDDAIAIMMTKMMRQGQGNERLEMWTTLAERAGTLASISWLASHVPTAVLGRVKDEMKLLDDLERQAVVGPILPTGAIQFVAASTVSVTSMSELSFTDSSDVSSSNDEVECLSDSSFGPSSEEDSSDDKSRSLTEEDGFPVGLSIDGEDDGDDDIDRPLHRQRRYIPDDKNQRQMPFFRESKKAGSSKFAPRFSKRSSSVPDLMSMSPHVSTTDDDSRISEQYTWYQTSQSDSNHMSSMSCQKRRVRQWQTNRKNSNVMASIQSIRTRLDSRECNRLQPPQTRRCTISMALPQPQYNSTTSHRFHKSISTGNLSGMACSYWSGASTRLRSVASNNHLSVMCFTNPLNLPYASKHKCAMLFVDISGFTRLSRALDPERLSNAINSYFHAIVNLVTAHGGDILKFAGDALFAEWKTSGDMNSRTPVAVRLEQCVCAAAACAAAVVAQCSDFPVEGSNYALNVHCGLGVGSLTGIHLGDCVKRREYVVMGEPIDQVSAAEGRADLGEVYASPDFCRYLVRCCSSYHETVSDAEKEPVLVAKGQQAFFVVKEFYKEALTSSFSSWTARDINRFAEKWTSENLERYRKLLSLYVHPVVVSNDTDARSNPTFKSTIEERHREEAELRSVYVMFIKPLISAVVTGDETIDRKTYRKLNDIMNVVTRELERFKGHLRQFIVDDKGVVLIACFGLRGSTFPNMVAENALPCTTVIHRSLETELGIKSKIGATIGNAYCGVVGGVIRHEYAVLGPSVNLAARLMVSPKNPGILVDNAVRNLSDRKFGFTALPPVPAKGYSEPVPIFVPLSQLERGWGRTKSNFVGRQSTIVQFSHLARSIALGSSLSKMMLLSGTSGMGKTTTVLHAIRQTQKILIPTKRHFLVTKHVNRESDRSVPFSAIGSLLIDAISSECSERPGNAEGGSRFGDESFSRLGSGTSSRSTQPYSPWIASDEEIKRGGGPILFERLELICKELNVPSEFLTFVRHHFAWSGFEAPRSEYIPPIEKGKAGSMVNFMAKVFAKCVEAFDLVIIALDDVFNMDEYSWRVLRELFESEYNLFIVCTSRPISSYSLSIDEDFWSTLNGQHRESGRFLQIKLETLKKEDVLTMISKTLEVPRDAIPLRLLHDVHTQSGGSPLYANEILENIKRHELGDLVPDLHDFGPRESRFGRTTFASLGQLILSRIDSLDASVRNVLSLGAVLGSSFELVEVVEIIRELVIESTNTRDQADIAKEALDVAVTTGILYVVYEGGESAMDQMGSQSVENLTYSFCHDIWRSTILKLMLESRRQDIHAKIAETLERRIQKSPSGDYLAALRVFRHWQACGNFPKAAALALSTSKLFENLGLNNQGIRILSEAVEIHSGESSSAKIACPGMPSHVLKAAGAPVIESIIKCFIALGKLHANIHDATNSVKAYQVALKTLQEAPASNEIADRSVVFPIFSGLYVAVKVGSIKQDENCTFEKGLATRFVQETKMHGDPAHSSRALAMLAETQARLGSFDEAIAAQAELEKVYDPVQHSKKVAESYGSDRSAQSIAVSSMWHMFLKDYSRALSIADYVVNVIMPEMNHRNVHNGMICMMPTLWVYLHHGKAREAACNFQKYVVGPFKEFFAVGAFTYFLPLYKPIEILLELASSQGQPLAEEETFIVWALEIENLRLPSIMNSCNYMGRLPGNITAEICLLLAMRLSAGEDRRRLLFNGLAIAEETLRVAETKRMLVAQSQLVPVYANLKEMAGTLANPKGQLEG